MAAAKAAAMTMRMINLPETDQSDFERSFNWQH
jgi:hypothetical protein